MLPNNPAILPAFQPVSIGADLHRSPHGASIDRVSVLIKPHEAGLGHGCRNCMEAIKRTDTRHEAWALVFEHLPDGFVAHLRMLVRLRIGQTSIFQPSIQLGV